MTLPQDHERLVRLLLNSITATDRFLECSADALLEELGLDSLGMIELVYGLEEQFGIAIADEEVTPDNFNSIRTLTRLVLDKRSLPADRDPVTSDSE
jgi:acyl carrier protein